MNLDDIDDLCDQYELALKKNSQLSPTEFCAQQKLSDDAQLLKELKRVAKAYGQIQSELDSSESLAAQASTVALDSNSHDRGTVGPYKLLQQIGEGGMGTVYMAEQESPVQRRVALKVIKPGMGSKEVVARFESERQALAMMNHENIAKMFDAGTMDDGRPFFVMELVRGVPLTKFCDENKLSIKERLELFITVCKAVQHAHQKGIIHRDIKPSNVLVSNYDGRPVPKVIDFGVAKAMQQKLTDKTLFTEFGRAIGTLQYMSPEQAGLSHLDIDTRSDIYSLGVLLYELLTGSTPIDKQRIREVGWERVMQLILEEEPPKPSTKISESGDAITGISAQRHSNPKSLGLTVKGDLDWIVMKSLEKDRTRRYETADGFALDLQRYLLNEPVSATPPSVMYRVHKFVLRNKVAVRAAMVIAFVLVAAIIGISSGLAWALKERQVAKERTKESEARFDLAIEAVESFYTGVSEDIHLKEPELEDLRGRLLRSAQEFYQKLADDLKGARTIEQRHDLAEATFALSRVALLVGAEEDALAAIHNSIEIMEDLVEKDSSNLEYQYGLAKRYLTLGGLERTTSSLEAAQTSFERAEEIAKSLVRQQPESVDYLECQGKAHNVLGELMMTQNKQEDSQKHLNRSLEIYTDLISRDPDRGQFHYDLAGVHNNLGVAANNNRKLDQARDHFQNAIDVIKPLVARDPNIEYSDYLARSLYNFGVWHRPRGELEKAENLYREAIVIWEELIAQSPTKRSFQSHLGTCYLSLGILHYSKNEYPEARRSYEEAIEIFDQLVKLSPKNRTFQKLLAQCYDLLGVIAPNLQVVQETYQESIEIWNRLIKDDPNDMSAQVGRAGALINYGVELKDGELTKRSLEQLNLGISGLEALQEQLANHDTAQRFLRVGYRSRAQVLTDLNRHQNAADDWLKAANLVSGEPKSIDELYYALSLGRYGEYPEAATVVDRVEGVAYSAAFTLSLLADLVQNDDALSTEDKERWFAEFSQRAFEKLRLAIESGYFQDPSHINDIRSNESFDSIRSQEEFKSILKQLDDSDQRT